MAVALLVVLLGFPVLYAMQAILFKWKRSGRVRSTFEAQGVPCLPRSFFHGNLVEFAAISARAVSQPMPLISHDVVPRILPDVHHWSKTYGDHFVYWFGFKARYVLKEPEQGRELLLTKSGKFKKPSASRPDANDVLGNGLVRLNGEKWAQHRRIVGNAFFFEKLQAMAPMVVALTTEMMSKWGPHVKRREPIDVEEEFKKLTGEVITRTAFGSSFEEGKTVFELQQKQQELFPKLISTLYIPGSRFLPTPQNRYRKSLKQRIHEGLTHIIEKRRQQNEVGGADTFGDDLLGLMLAANDRQQHVNNQQLSMGVDEIIEECKTFFFAGHETTATLLTFMFLLLASHPEWQERLREEVFESCAQTAPPTAESLNHFKLMSMVINETLRLYPPAPMTTRVADTDVRLGQTLVPAGTLVIVPIAAWHHDERFWGADANEFRPERFEGGVAKACRVPGAFLPFSIGPRNCIGQQFAIIEAKMVLATILQRYRFWLSPMYLHAPMVLMTLRTQFGMPLIFEELS